MNENNTKNTLLIIIGALAVIGVVWAMNERNARKTIEKKLDKKEKDYLVLLKEYLEKRGSLPQEILDQIIRLKEDQKGVSPEIQKRLSQVIDLLQSGQDQIAVEKLALIIENLLKDKYIAEGKAKDKKSCPTFYNLLKLALDLKWITQHHFSFSLFIKDKRNEEAHEVEATFGKNETYISLLAGLELVVVLASNNAVN